MRSLRREGLDKCLLTVHNARVAASYLALATEGGGPMPERKKLNLLINEVDKLLFEVKWATRSNQADVCRMVRHKWVEEEQEPKPESVVCPQCGGTGWVDSF